MVPGASGIEDLFLAPRIKQMPCTCHIFDTLLKEKRFIAFDTRGNEYVEEQQDKALVGFFSTQ